MKIPAAPFPPQAADGPSLGACLRQLRVQRKLSIAQVSAATGLAKSTLSRVENGLLSLTYDKLLQLCRGLQIDFTQLFSYDPANEDTRRRLTRRTFTAPGGGRLLEVNLQAYTYLCTDLAGKKMTPMTGVVHSRTLAQTNGLLKHPGEEFSYVLEGRLELHTEFYAPMIVEVGGSAYFDSTMGHAYVSVGDKPLKFLCVCSTPEPALTEVLSQGAGQSGTASAVPRKGRRRA